MFFLYSISFARVRCSCHLPLKILSSVKWFFWETWFSFFFHYMFFHYFSMVFFFSTRNIFFFLLFRFFCVAKSIANVLVAFLATVCKCTNDQYLWHAINVLTSLVYILGVRTLSLMLAYVLFIDNKYIWYVISCYQLFLLLRRFKFLMEYYILSGIFVSYTYIDRKKVTEKRDAIANHENEK